MKLLKKIRRELPVSLWETLFMLAVSVYLVAVVFNAFLRYNKLQLEAASLNDAIARLAKANASQRQWLQARMNPLLEDPWIRQELGMVKPDEVAVIFVKGTHERNNANPDR
jgi:cell division protein FtsB